MEAATAEEETVDGGVGVEPSWEVEGGLNEEEVAVGVEELDGEFGEVEGGLEEEEDDEPLVVEVVSVPELSVEVGDGGGRWGEGEGEGLVLVDVVGGVGGEVVEDFEVEGVEL